MSVSAERAVVSLPVVMDLGAVRTWPEAVAIILEAGTAMALSGLAVDAGDIAITATGATEITGRRTVRHDGTAASLGALLELLLENLEAPFAVRALASADAARGRSVAEYLSVLAPFEPPDRGSLLEGIAGRALRELDDALGAFGPAAAPNPTIQAVTMAPRWQTPVRHDPSPQHTGPTALAAEGAAVPHPPARVLPDMVHFVPPPTRRLPPHLNRLVAAAAVVALVAAAAAWQVHLWTLPPTELPALPSPPVLAAAAAAPIETALTDSSPVPVAMLPLPGLRPTSLPVPGAAPPAAATRGVPPATPPSVPPATPTPNGAPVPFPSQSMWGPWIAASPLTSAATSRPASPPQPPPVVAAGSAATIASEDMAPEAPLPEERVYGAADADVDPPMFLRRQVRSLPEDAGTGPVDLLLLVDEAGQVVQVKMNPADAKLRDSLLLPAAKAWQFRPAMKGDQPVRYWLRVPVAR